MTTAAPRIGSARLGLVAMVGLAVLAGCSGAASPSASTAALTQSPPSVAPSVAPASVAPTESATAGASEATAVPTAVDPCQLVTAQEASQLAGTTFGPGVEKTETNNTRTCVYGGQTLNVFTVEVAQAADVATAQAAKAKALEDIKTAATKGITVTQLPSLADGGVVAEGGGTISGVTLNISSIGVLKGTIFFGFSDLVLNKPAPTSAALQAQAQVCLGRLP